MTVFACEFASSKENGHWHKTYAEAQDCMDSWRKWRHPVRTLKSLKHGFANKPHGVFGKDLKF